MQLHRHAAGLPPPLVDDGQHRRDRRAGRGAAGVHHQQQPVPRWSRQPARQRPDGHPLRRQPHLQRRQELQHGRRRVGPDGARGRGRGHLGPCFHRRAYAAARHPVRPQLGQRGPASHRVGQRRHRPRRRAVERRAGLGLAHQEARPGRPPYPLRHAAASHVRFAHHPPKKTSPTPPQC